MEADIYFFYDITPNKSGGIYDMPTAKQAPFSITNRDDTWGRMYLEHLKVKNAATLPNASDRYYTLHAQSYNVYGDFVDVPVRGTSATLLKYAFITYMCIVPISASNYGKLWFYHVNRIIPLPDKYRLYITPDNWANYIGYADIHNVNVSRSLFVLNPYAAALTNSVKSIGRQNAQPRPIRKYFTSQIAPGANVKLSDLRIYAAINYQATRDSAKELYSYQQALYVFDPKQVLGVSNITTKLQLLDAIGAVQTIYGIVSSTAIDPQPATVTKLYLYDRTLAGSIADETALQAFACIRAQSKVNISGMPVEPQKKYMGIQVKCGGGYYSSIVTDTEVIPGRAVSVGSLENRQDLPQFIGLTNILFYIYINYDGLQFLVVTSQGAKDITQAYEISLGKSTSTPLTQNEQIAKSLGIISSVVSSGAQIFGGAASLTRGNITGITSITSGGLSLANAFVNANIDKPENPTFIQGGGGLLTYAPVWDNPNQASSIYLVEGDNNTINPETDIKYNGAAVDYSIYEASDFDFFDYFYRLHTLNYYYLDDVKYGALQLTADINDIPTDAADEIQAKFNEGVRINFVTTTT